MRRKPLRLWVVVGAAALVLVGGWFAFEAVTWHLNTADRRAALEALDRRDFREAGTLLDKCIRLWPDDVELLLLAARAARQRENYPEAQRLLQEYVRKNGSPEAVARERLLLTVQQGNLQDADRLLASCAADPRAADSALALEAVIIGSLRQLGRGLASNRSFQDEPASSDLARALRAVDLWLQSQPATADQVQGLIWRGRLHFFANDYPHALADAQQALELAPDSLDARLNLVIVVAQKSPDEALSHLETLRQKYPDNVSVRRSLASVHRGLGQSREAAAILDGLLAADPKDVAALVERGHVALDQQQLREAEQFLRRAEKQEPDAPEVVLALSRYLRLAGRDDEAKQYHDRYRQLTTDRP